jgi:uncharacterized protein YigA (DUF484 family)
MDSRPDVSVIKEAVKDFVESVEVHHATLRNVKTNLESQFTILDGLAKPNKEASKEYERLYNMLLDLADDVVIIVILFY